jgi:hypothetical protein
VYVSAVVGDQEGAGPTATTPVLALQRIDLVGQLLDLVAKLVAVGDALVDRIRDPPLIVALGDHRPEVLDPIGLPVGLRGEAGNLVAQFRDLGVDLAGGLLAQGLRRCHAGSLYPLRVVAQAQR